MLLVRPSFEIAPFDGEQMLQDIERAGRICYKSEDKIDSGSAVRFVKHLATRGHESVIEHAYIRVTFVIDRGVSHELVRHRLCAFSQESTRYCNYRGGVTFVIPPWISNVCIGQYTFSNYQTDTYETRSPQTRWLLACLTAEEAYLDLLSSGWTPQQARSVLPNSLKTEITVTANVREWRHIFRLRTSKAAHPQMREIMRPLLTELQKRVKVLFDDIAYQE